jgi:cysteine rich repeat protein
VKPTPRDFTGGRCLALGSLVIGVALLPGIARSATPCLTDIEKFCANVPIGGGRIQTCLKEHEKELSPECAARHENLEKEMGRLAASCRYDISRFCWDISPGRGRVGRCLERHRSDLSPVCNDQLRKAAHPPAK